MRKARKHARVKSKETAGQPKAQPIAAQTGAEGQPSRIEPFPIVGIGASAGGLEAFTQLLKHLPADTGMGFVLVQHLDPDHDSALVQILARVTSMPVREVANELRIAPNHVYIIPPNTDMATAQGVLKLQRRQAGRAPHHSIDFFFESLARDQHECAIGVILSGTASDGTLGMEAIKADGGVTFAQDESARYDSMPRSAIAAGCVDFVLSPKNIMFRPPVFFVSMARELTGRPCRPGRCRTSRSSCRRNRNPSCCRRIVRPCRRNCGRAGGALPRQT